MPDLEAGSFTIRALLERPAADFDADVPDSAVFTAATEADRVTLEAGYRDVAGQATYIGQVKKGIVDEWEITLAPAVIQSRVRGRDALTRLLERPITKLFPRSPAREVTETVATVAEGGGNVRIPAVAQAPHGRWRASQIAQTIIDDLNASLPAAEQLTLSWETRDYEIRSDYSASGRPIDVIADLASPWSQARPSTVDVLLEGLTIIVRNRVPVPSADYAFPLEDARIKQVTITKRRPQRLGEVILSGMSVQIEGAGLIGQELPDPTVEIEETPNRTEVEYQTPTGTVRYRVPDGVLLKSVKTVFADSPTGGQHMIARETIDNTWDEVQYDNGRPLSAASQRTQRTAVEGIHPSDKAKTFQPLRTEAVSYDYDAQDYLTRITAIKRELNLKARTLDLKERVIKDYTDIGPLQYEIVTTTARWNNKLGIWGLINRDGATASGYRPGGPGRSKVLFIPADRKPGENDSGQLLPVMIQKTISADPDAQPLSYANENLTLEDLEFILVQLEEASGLWEYELVLECVTMPWLKKGVGIQFTECKDKNGVLIPFHPGLPAGHLRPALVVEHTIRYVEAEGEDASSLTSLVRALYWSAT